VLIGLGASAQSAEQVIRAAHARSCRFRHREDSRGADWAVGVGGEGFQMLDGCRPLAGALAETCSSA
jgi:hypothetical protein